MVPVLKIPPLIKPIGKCQVESFSVISWQYNVLYIFVKLSLFHVLVAIEKLSFLSTMMIQL